jgi:peptidoglycan/xylan/chitin deacetylase (PgdA/CDA1 family)
MKWYKKAFYGASSMMPLNLLGALSPTTTLFPYHHLVSDEDVPHIKQLYSYKNVKQFTADLDFLLRHFRPITTDDLLKSIENNNRLPAKSFLLSFDDGLSEVYDIAAPILSRKGVPAILFINPAFVDNRELFYRCKISLVIDLLKKNNYTGGVIKQVSALLNITDLSLPLIFQRIREIDQREKHVLDKIGDLLEFSFDEYLNSRKPFMTAQQIKELSVKGFTIGAHSWDHPYYKFLSGEEQINQTVSSCNYVQENFSPSCNTFSFPHFDSSLPQSLFDQLLRQQPKIDLLFGIQNQKMELNNRMIHRFNAERPDVNFNSQVKGLMIFMMLQQVMGKNKVIRK